MKCIYNDCGWCYHQGNLCITECLGYEKCNNFKNRKEFNVIVKKEEGKEGKEQKIGNLREYECTTYLIPKELLIDFDTDIIALYEKEEEVNRSGKIHEYETDIEELGFLQSALDMRWGKYKVEGELYNFNVLMPGEEDN